MPDLITIDRSQLRDQVIIITQEVLKELGIKSRDVKPWISKNRASKLIGRRKLDTAIRNNQVKCNKPDYENPRGRVYVLRKDIEKLIAKPL